MMRGGNVHYTLQNMANDIYAPPDGVGIGVPWPLSSHRLAFHNIPEFGGVPSE